jgi:hypothetical protein
MTVLADLKIVQLQGRPCSVEELRSLRTWAKSRIHWSARILQAVVRQKGYLLEIDAATFSHPQWYGIDFEDVKQTLHISSIVFADQE